MIRYFGIDLLGADLALKLTDPSASLGALVWSIVQSVEQQRELVPSLLTAVADRRGSGARGELSEVESLWTKPPLIAASVPTLNSPLEDRARLAFSLQHLEHGELIVVLSSLGNLPVVESMTAESVGVIAAWAEEGLRHPASLQAVKGYLREVAPKDFATLPTRAQTDLANWFVQEPTRHALARVATQHLGPLNAAWLPGPFSTPADLARTFVRLLERRPDRWSAILEALAGADPKRAPELRALWSRHGLASGPPAR